MRIDRLDLSDPDARGALGALVRLSYGSSATGEGIRLNTTVPDGPFPTLHLGAFQGDELIGFNAFIPHRFTHCGDTLVAYQSCWSCTSPEHRGKGVFVGVIEAAKTILAEDRAAFIFGFPNENSKRIFLGPLGFADLGGFRKVNIPLRRPFLRLALRSHGDAATGPVIGGAVVQNDAELFLMKQREGRGAVTTLEDQSNNAVWGRPDRRKVLGASVPYYRVGGLRVNNPNTVDSVLLGIARETGSVFAQYVYHHTSFHERLFRFARPAPTVSPLIGFSLGRDVREFEHWDLCLGVMDVF